MEYKRYFLPLLLAGCILLLIIGSAVWIWSRPDGGLSWRTGVYEILIIDPQGPAVAFQIGDIIIAQDDQPIEQVRPRFGIKQPGEVVTFTIARAGIILEQTIRLRPPSSGVLVERIQPALIAFGFWLIGVIAWSQKPKANEVRLFFFFCLLIAGVLGAGNLSAHDFPGARGVYGILLGLLAPVSFHFHLLFPRPTRLERLRPLLTGLYLVGLFLGLWSVLGNAGLLPNPTLPFLYIYLTLMGLASLSILIRTYYDIVPQQERQRVRAVVVGTITGISPLLFGSIIPDILLGEPGLPYYFSFLFLGLVPLAYAYAIYRHDFLQLDRYADRTLVLFALTACLVGGYLLLINILNQILPPVWQGHPMVGALVALLLASLFSPLHQRLMKLLDRLLYGSWYDYQSAVQTFSTRLSNTVQTNQLIEILTEQLPTLLKARGTVLLRPTEQDHLSVWDKGGDVQAWWWQIELVEQPTFAVALQSHLLAQGKPCHFNSIWQTLWAALLSRPNFDETKEDTLWIPLACTGRLMGVLVLGPKYNDNGFNWKDIQILETLSYQAAVVIQQVQLIESLSQHAAEMDRLYQAVLTAREAERKHLARELHDSVIQDLISLNHRLEGFLEPAPQAQTEEHAMQGEIRQLLDNLRGICAGLRPPTLDSLGLVSAVRFHLHEFEEATSLSAKLTVKGDECTEMPEEIELCLFRVLQEALNNIQRHAQATEVSVVLDINKKSVELLIGDNGRGFNVPERLGQLVTEGHFGLAGLRERAETVGGRLSIRSDPSTGTWLWIKVPLLAVKPLPSPYKISQKGEG